MLRPKAPWGIVEATPPAGELFDAALELAKSLRSKGKDEKTRDTCLIDLIGILDDVGWCWILLDDVDDDDDDDDGSFLSR